MENCNNPVTIQGGGAPVKSAPDLHLAVLNSLTADCLSEPHCISLLCCAAIGDPAKCPHCHAPVESNASLYRYRAGKKNKCRRCGRWFTWRTNTVFRGSKLSASQLVLVAACLALGHDNKTIAQLARCSSETVRTWRGIFGVNHA